jgi:hypothetical protein
MPWLSPPVNNQNCRRYDDRFSERHPSLIERCVNSTIRMDRSIFPRLLFYLDVFKKRHKKQRAIIVHKGSSSGIRVARLTTADELTA